MWARAAIILVAAINNEQQAFTAPSHNPMPRDLDRKKCPLMMMSCTILLFTPKQSKDFLPSCASPYEPTVAMTSTLAASAPNVLKKYGIQAGFS
jgi:hypothetical protein